MTRQDLYELVLVIVIIIICSVDLARGDDTIQTDAVTAVTQVSPIERKMIADEIAKQQLRAFQPYIDQHLRRREADHTRMTKRTPKAQISWEEIKLACGTNPSDQCITRYYNDRIKPN